MHYLSEQNIFIFLVQIFLLLGLARVLGDYLQIKWNQPSISVEILVGILLGPTILGRIFPAFQILLFPQEIVQQSMLETVAWLGVFFLLLETGLEMDFSAAWRQRKTALKIALTSIGVPFVITFIVCLFLPVAYLSQLNQKFAVAFFMATVISVSAMPVVARTLNEMKLLKSNLGFLTMSSLAVKDILGWLMFSLLLGYFTQSKLQIGQSFFMLLMTIGFIVICLKWGKIFTNFVILKIKEKRLNEPASSLTFVCLLGLLCGAITQKLGIHALFGFFIAGVMAGEAKALSEMTRRIISQMVYAIFIPLFFVNIGLKIDFFSNFNIYLVLFITVIGIAGRFAGARMAVTFSGYMKENRTAIAISHIPGGMMEIVMGSIAMEFHLITEPVFVAIVFGAVVSSMIFGPWLNYSISHRKIISMLEYFSKRNLTHQIKANHRDGVIHELCEIALTNGYINDVDDITKSIIDRENAMGTAIEKGIAVPHTHSSGIKRPMIIFGRSLIGIDWNSPDGQPTHFVFLIITPEGQDDLQVQILRSIAVVMESQNVREILLRTQDRQEIWSIIEKEFDFRKVTKK